MVRVLFFSFIPLLFISTTVLASEPPSPATYGVRMEQAWIPMKDGVRLAATLYMPDGAKPGEKFPALLEYLPYRKDDGTAAGDYPKHAYFARRGYVSVRVDIRGFGASEGAPPEREYSEREQTDGEQVIAWLAHQPWSNGNVGMFGISWGGFTALQMAMHHAPELKAILAVDATAELFHDDVHYIDGMAHIDEFELNMDMAEGWTGAPDYTLDEKVLGPRFETPPWSLLYLKHQHDGAFWRDRVRPLKEITIPSFLIGGLLDGYRDNVPDMLMQASGPVKAIVGPWNHTFPNDAVPGPQIEWRNEAVRWFDHWLKGRDTGVERDPRLVIYMQHWHPPDPSLDNVPGEWRREDVWPPKDARASTLFLQSDHGLANHGLAESAAQRDVHQLRYVPSVGVEAGFWWGELLSDVRPVDAFSLVYDSAPLPEDVAILGRPQALLRASATAPLADWFARLSDVAPDGSVTQITGAGINGAQRDSMSDPRDLAPGEVYALDIEMHLTSWVFPKGHRIRVAISNALWPMMLPTPYSMTTSLQLGGNDGSRIVLPVVQEHGDVAPAFSLPEPSEERTDVKTEGFPWPGEWTVERDEARHKTTVHWKGQEGGKYPWGTETDYENLTYKADDAHPETCSVRGEAETVFALKGRTLTWRGHLLVTTDQKNFYYKYTRELLEDGTMIKSKTWQETIARDHQ
jgi:predicted acyl esterase